MSSIVLSTKHIAAVSNGLTRLLNHSCGIDTLTAAPDLYKALSNCSDRYGFFDESKIYNELYRLNLVAYNGRYKMDTDSVFVPDFPQDFPRLIGPLEWSNAGSNAYHWILSADYFAFSKVLSAFIYQCEEDVTRNTNLLKALQNTLDEFNKFLVDNTAAYVNADWLIS